LKAGTHRMEVAICAEYMVPHAYEVQVAMGEKQFLHGGSISVPHIT